MNIIPPRLNKKIVYAWFEVIEIFVLIGAVILICIANLFKLLIPVAIVAVLIYRRDGENSFLSDFTKIFRFYAAPAAYITKGVNTYGQDSAYNKPD